MEIKHDGYEYVVIDGQEKYVETKAAVPTSRLLDGSRDTGYMAEYKGYGVIGELPVIAVYLVGYEEEDTEDEGEYDWDKALAQGRIVVDVDALSDEQCKSLIPNGEGEEVPGFFTEADLEEDAKK